MAVKPKEILIFEDNKGRKPFTEWLESLDIVIRARIENRILRLHQGNYGDYKTLQEGVNELRLQFGAGYRVYYAEDGNTLVILLSGGDKGTQKKDIKKAIGYWKEYKEEKHG
jgi:putative addiction module killer protein